MFQRMEPPSEGGGTDGQGGQAQNGLSSTQPDKINSMWVDREAHGPCTEMLQIQNDLQLETKQ